MAEFLLVAMDDEVDVEIISLTDEEIENLAKALQAKNKYKNQTELVNDILSHLRSRGYSVSEDRVKRILRDANIAV